eukprot:356150-Rhodomonas_salina.2
MPVHARAESEVEVAPAFTIVQCSTNQDKFCERNLTSGWPGQLNRVHACASQCLPRSVSRSDATASWQRVSLRSGRQLGRHTEGHYPGTGVPGERVPDKE